MRSELIDRMTVWVSASTWRVALVRYVGTVVVILAVIALAALTPLKESAWILVVVAVVGCGWFGGVGPSLLAPVLVVMLVRAAQKEPDQLFAFSVKELSDLGVFLLLSSAIGWSGLVRRRAQNLARHQARQLQQEADRKDRFLATLAHELRNPLAPLRTGLQVLQLAGNASADSSLVADVYGMMQRQVDQLTRLIDDLLDVSRINTGKFELRREQIRFQDVIQDAVDASRPHMDAAGHQFDVAVDDGGVVFQCDRARVSQIVLNLLNNAAKFTPPHGQIRLSGARRGNALEICVRDNGIGIPPEMLPKTFEMFTQLDNSRSRSHGGLGIGLHLVRTLAEMHGGSVTARSPGPGHGSEFIVRLPLLPESAAKQNDVHPPERLGTDTMRSRRILIVDDNVNAARSLSMLLGVQAHQCATAHNGEQALAMTASFEPDVIILDIGLPGMDGYELARRLRAMPNGASLLLIAVTGWGREDDRRRSIEAGCDHHLVKPAGIEALQELLRAG